ncbi:MAG: D-alanyl-D-alanine carboxypeptidase family protein [Acidimicrobiales bacterium]
MDDRRPVACGRKIAAAIAAGLVVTAIWAPSTGQALPGQEEPGDQAGTGAGSATIDIDVDVASGSEAALAGTLEEIQANVASQLSQLDAAQAVLVEAEAAVTAAGEAVAATQAEIDELTARSDEVVIETFMSPPSLEITDALESDTVNEASMRQALLGIRADADASVLADLEEARQRFEAERELEDEAEGEAQARRADAEAALSAVQAATGQQASFLGEIQARLDEGLAEAAALANVDPEMAAELTARAAALADELQAIADSRAYQAALDALAEAERRAAEEAAANPPDPVTLGPSSGSLATVSCPAGGSITVDSSLEGPLSSLLQAAAADGVTLCGSGYRSPEAQIEVRRSNCGTSDYAIYDMPASDCSPPTARPGTSEHEVGLAIDFTCGGGGVISSTGSSCYQWLDANAAGYGLYQLPSEIWHWSTTGN